MINKNLKNFEANPTIAYKIVNATNISKSFDIDLGSKFKNQIVIMEWSGSASQKFQISPHNGKFTIKSLNNEGLIHVEN